jgi:hypothetical protein
MAPELKAGRREDLMAGRGDDDERGDGGAAGSASERGELEP